MRYTLPMPFWMSLMDGGLQDRGAIAIQSSWPSARPLRTLLLPNVSSVFFLSTVLRKVLLSIDNIDISAALLHQGVKCAQYVPWHRNSLVPQQARVSVDVRLTAACRTSWVRDFTVSSVIRWTYVRIANLRGCPVIWIPRMVDMTLRTS